MPYEDIFYDDKDGRAIITGIGGVDYLTCTTFNPYVAQKWEALVRERYPSEPTTHREKMYSGEDYEGVAKVLVGRQSSMPHWKFNFSGVDADSMMVLLHQHDCLFRDDIGITRLDIQITTRKYKNRIPIARIHDNLKAGKYGQIAGSGKTSLHLQSSDTGDTLYVGSQWSDKRTRYYTKNVKSNDDSQYELERYEVMYRRETAEKAAAMILEGKEHLDRARINEMLLGDMERLPTKMKVQMRCYAYLKGHNPVYVPRSNEPRIKTSGTRWVMKMADALLKYARQAGENGMTVRGILMRILVMAISTDPLEDVERWTLLSGDGEVVEVFGIDYTSGGSDSTEETEPPTE